MNENKRKGIKKILLFLRCFRLEKCIQLPAAGKRKPSPLLPVIFCAHSHSSLAAAEWHGIFIKQHQKDRREGKGHSRRLETQQTWNLKLLKKISISLYHHRLFLYFSNTVDMVEKTLKNWPLPVDTSSVVMGYYSESNGKPRVFFVKYQRGSPVEQVLWFQYGLFLLKYMWRPCPLWSC